MLSRHTSNTSNADRSDAATRGRGEDPTGVAIATAYAVEEKDDDPPIEATATPLVERRKVCGVDARLFALLVFSLVGTTAALVLGTMAGTGSFGGQSGGTSSVTVVPPTSLPTSILSAPSSMPTKCIRATKLLATDRAPDDRFGDSVALSGDTAIIGAAGDDNKNGERSGSAYVFARHGGAWVQLQKLLPSDGAASDWFGSSVASDGETTVIGAPYSNDNGYWSGSAYIFSRAGDAWIQLEKLLPNDGATREWFGNSVALDGNTAIIGAPYHGIHGNSSGAAYVFTRAGDNWTQLEKLLPDDEEAEDRFGFSIALDGDAAIIGAPYDDDNGARSGAAYVFTREGDTWVQLEKLLPDDGVAEDEFGRSVALDGDTALIGAPKDSDKGDNSGATYIFKRVGDAWVQQEKLVPNDGAAWDRFGYSVALDGNTAAIGTWGDTQNGNGSDAAYVFTRVGDAWVQLEKLDPNGGAEDDQSSSKGRRTFSLVALYGGTVIMGVPYDNDSNGGSAYAFDFCQ